MANIPYVTRGKYLPACAAFVQAHAAIIANGKRVIWNTGWQRGYGGKHMALIELGKTFNATAFPYTDPSRFPLRLRALATALRDHGLLHPFFMSHQNGVITLQRADFAPAGITAPLPPSSARQAKRMGTGGQSASSPNTFGSNPSPILIVPEVNGDDRWWVELRDLVSKAMAAGVQIGKIIFRGGGTVPIPDWFRDWCRQNGIEIEILDPEQFDEPGDEGLHIESQPN